MSEATETQPAAELAARFLPLKWWQAGLLVLGAAGCFHAAYTPAKPGPLALLIVGYVVCLVQLARMRTRRQALGSVWFFLAGGALTACWGVLQHYGLPGVSLDRPVSFFGRSLGT